MHIIFGRAGTGKSEYIYQSIKRVSSGKVYIITPEQFSFSAEKRLVETVEGEATTKVEVLSFARMAHKVMRFMGLLDKDVISKSGKSMIIYDAISKNQKDLKFLGKSNDNVQTIITGITEFKKHNITVEDLRKRVEDEKNEYLKAKLNDMLIMYEALSEKIESFIDENDVLNILADNIEESHLFDGATFYLDEFAGFTKQEYNVIEKLNRIGEVYVVVCSDELRINKNPENDVFYDNKKTIASLIDLTDHEIAEDNIIKLQESHRFHNKELEHLEKNLYGIPYKKYDGELSNISLFLAKNIYDEISNVADQIIKLVRNEGYKYKDISIISKNIEQYSSITKAIFSSYDIPIFIDEEKDITQDIFIRYALSIIDIFDQNFSYESMFNYLKTGFVDIENIFGLENYIVKYGIKGKKWYEKDWDSEFNEDRKKIIEPLLSLKEKLSGRKTAKQISEGLYEFIKISLAPYEDDIKENSELLECWNIVVELLEEISKIFGDEQMTFERFSKIIKSGLSNRELGHIPETQDKVTLADVDRSRSQKKKAIFIVGLNDGVFPSVSKDEGFFSDKDRDELRREGFELAKTTLEKTYEENFNIYRAFTTAEDKLFLSYPISDEEGGALRKSILISRLKKIFPNLEENSLRDDIIATKDITFEKLLNNIDNPDYYELLKWYENNEKEKLSKALEGLRFSNLPERVTDENIKRLYGDKLNTSVSKLETYESCAFMYYLQYGLKLKEKETSEIKTLDTGSFMHNVIDEFFKTSNNVKEMTKEMIEEKISSIVEEELHDFEKFTLNAKYQILVQRLKRVITLSVIYIIEGLKASSFEILGNEVSFGEKVPKANFEGSNQISYPPIEIELENGKKVVLEGKIDRIDIARLPDGNYLRIIDYKSSNKDIDFSKVYAGLQLQLLTYAKVATENEKMEPAGVLYYNLIEPIVKDIVRNNSDEEIEEEIKKQFKMNGLILADINVIRAMDNNIEEESSIIPAKILKDKETLGKNDSLTTKEEFEKLLQFTDETLKKISKEILSGNISIRPYYDVKGKSTPCQYCPYKSICGFNSKFKGNSYKVVSKVKKSELIDKIDNAKK